MLRNPVGCSPDGAACGAIRVCGHQVLPDYAASGSIRATSLEGRSIIRVCDTVFPVCAVRGTILATSLVCVLSEFEAEIAARSQAVGADTLKLNKGEAIETRLVVVAQIAASEVVTEINTCD